MMRWMLMLLLATALPAMLHAEEEGAWGRNPRLFVVPAPATVTIDGDLADWDTSAGMESYISEMTYDARRVITLAMYDDEAFYLGARVWDDTPMMNRHDPQVNAPKAWDADAFQFRIYLKPRYPGNENQWGKPEAHDEMAHLLLWYYTDRQEPNLQVFYSMAYVPPAQGWSQGVVPHDRFDAAYRKWDDGTGYTMEYRIPWATLNEEHRPRPGDVTAANVQVQWGRPDGLKTLGHEGWVVDLLRKPGFPYQTSECWGKAIFATRGQLPPAASAGRGGPIAEVAPEPTPLRFTYDLPRSGHVSIGLYDQQNVLRRQVVAEAPRHAGSVTEAWNGLDDRGEPLAPGTYTWRGIVSDPITTEFILSVHNSGTPPYKTDDNTGGWGGDHGNPTTVAAAGEHMLLAWRVAESGWGIIRTDLTGDKHWGTKTSAEHLAVSDAADRFFVVGGHGFDRHPGVRVFAVEDSRPLNFTSGEPGAERPQAAAADHATVTGLAAAEGRLYVSYGRADVIAVNDAASGTLLAAWTVEAPGRLAVAADGTLLAISGGRIVRLTDGQVRPFAEAHLDEPQGIAVDGEGRVYVTNQGELHHVSVFSAAGEYLRSIGTPGGRPAIGRFDPRGMLAPGGCAIDAQGRLWVAETLDYPKRISVWDTSSGDHLQQFFGGSSYFGWAWMDPSRPDEVYCHNVIWKVDLDQRTKQIHSTIWRATEPNMVRPASPGGYAGHFRVFTADNGRQFGFGMARHNPVVFIRDGDLFKPFLHSFPKNAYPATETFPTDDVRHNILLWQDANDDQTIQVEECIVSPGKRRELMLNWVASDLSIWNDNGTRLTPVRFDGDRPIYDFTQLEETGFRGRNFNCASLWFDDYKQDGVYRLNPGHEHSLSKWTADGELIWSTGTRVTWHRALGYGAMGPGDLWGLTMPLGLAGNYTGAASYFNPYHLFTRDGVYVAMIMRAGQAGGGLGADITASETLTGQLVKPEGMDRYFLLAGDQDGRITEVHGLDTVEYLAGGSITLTEDDVQRVVEAQRTHAAAQQRQGALFVQRYPVSLDTPHGEVVQRVDDDRAFRAQLARDGERLFMRYHVQSPAPLINAEPDPTVIFKGGNLMDVQLATDPGAAPQREKPAAGDVRLLVSQRADGAPVAVLFQPRVANFAGEPIVLRSPTGSESFDAITVLGDVQLEVTPTDAGFTATASVPLSALGWQPVSGQVLRGDLGYLFGNETGTRVSIRSYWHNDSFSANVTDDIPNESRLEPHEWGTVVVE